MCFEVDLWMDRWIADRFFFLSLWWGGGEYGEMMVVIMKLIQRF
jgi:hypothetical protein